MIEYIKNNPYRVLGVYANDPEKKWVENSLELYVSLKQDNSFMFPTDWVDVLGPLNRTIRDVKDAAFLLEDSPSQQIESLFWVHNRGRGSFYANLKSGGIDLEMGDALTDKLYSQSINKAVNAIVVERNLDKALNNYKTAFNYKRPSSETLFEFFGRALTEFIRVSPNGNPFAYFYHIFGDDFRPEFEMVLVTRTKNVNSGSHARTEINEERSERERERKKSSTKKNTYKSHKIEWDKVCAKFIKPWAQFNSWTYITIVLLVILLFCLVNI